MLGPSAGDEEPQRRTRLPISYQGRVVGELWADGELDDALLARVAELISAHVLLGWDTGGEAREPVAHHLFRTPPTALFRAAESHVQWHGLRPPR